MTHAPGAARARRCSPLTTGSSRSIPYPAATDDALGSYRGRLQTGIRPERIGLFGESAGGALTLGAIVARRDAGLAESAAPVL